MKTKYYSLIFLIALAFSSCDYVEMPITSNDPGSNDTGEVQIQRNVLLEEFTGHKCGPCPGAALEARTLQASFEDDGYTFIVMSIHAGGLAVPTGGNYDTDFRTPDGDWIANNVFIGFSYTPVGLINRRNYNGYPWIDYPDWYEAGDSIFIRPLEVSLTADITYNASTKAGTINAQSTFLANMSNDYYMVACITQDSIVDYQTNGSGSSGDPAYPAGDVSNYVHRHVFRGFLNGSGGDEVISGGAGIGLVKTNTINFDLDNVIAAFPASAPALDPAHVSVIIYVYDVSTKEILQVIEKHLEE